MQEKKRRTIIVAVIALAVGFVLGWAVDLRKPAPVQSSQSNPKRDSILFRMGQLEQIERSARERIDFELALRKKLRESMQSKTLENDYKNHFDTAGFRSLVDSLFAE